MMNRLNVAKLANVPKGVIDVAAVKSKELEESIARKKMIYL
jgi:DNA mismatch repair protein MSH3